jgi:tricarballylate dehydrogenase
MRRDPRRRRLPSDGLYAAGEIAGGLFYHNYASGTGLMSGAVFGRLAGTSAAAFARSLDYSAAAWIYVI